MHYTQRQQELRLVSELDSPHILIIDLYIKSKSEIIVNIAYFSCLSTNITEIIWKIGIYNLWHHTAIICATSIDL